MFKILMGVLLINALYSTYMMIMVPAPNSVCAGGIMMTYNKKLDMWVQPGWFPEHCMPIDRN